MRHSSVSWSWKHRVEPWRLSSPRQKRRWPRCRTTLLQKRRLLACRQSLRRRWSVSWSLKHRGEASRLSLVRRSRRWPSCRPRGSFNMDWQTKSSSATSIGLALTCRCCSAAHATAQMKLSGTWPSNIITSLSISWALGMSSGPARRQKQSKGTGSSTSSRNCLRAQKSPKRSTKRVRVVFLEIRGRMIGRQELLKWQRDGIFFK
mmetsp:Transcript_33766/g.85579  ORF Transcript_33766/g.85579 Transcript_33766/m.85579 type:complete len:205 (-) Transcript_33766:149-763(-)